MRFEVRRFQRGDERAVRTVLTEAFGDAGEVAGLAETLRARADRQCSLVAVADLTDERNVDTQEAHGQDIDRRDLCEQGAGARERGTPDVGAPEAGEQAAGEQAADEQAADEQAADEQGTDPHAVIGYVHLSISWVDAPSRLVEVLTLSPLGVAPAHQRRGVGSALARAAIAAARDLDAPLVFLEGDPNYYGRFGWRPATELGFRRPSDRIPEPGFQVVPLAAYEPATMTGPLVYNDTFWSLDFVGLRP